MHRAQAVGDAAHHHARLAAPRPLVPHRDLAAVIAPPSPTGPGLLSGAAAFLPLSFITYNSDPLSYSGLLHLPAIAC